MDAPQEHKFIYSIPVTEKKEGETPIYRKPSSKEKLFTIPEKYTCLADCWDDTLSQFPQNKLIEDFTYVEVDKMMKRAGSWFLEHGHSVIFLYSKNCPNWTITDIACWNYGLINVPLYDTLGPEAFEHILDITEGTALLTTQSLFDRTLAQMQKNKYKVKQVIFFDDFTAEQKEKLEALQLKVYSFSDLLSYEQVKQRPKVTLDNHITYAFTSGTTGIPKGVVYPQRMVLSTVFGISQNHHFCLDPTDVHISYLPIAHLFERFVSWDCIIHGANMQYCRLPPTQLVKEFARIKPTSIPLVPRLMNRFYPILKGLYESEGNNIKIKGLFGGRLKKVIIGSAPVSSQVLSFFQKVTECDLREGYGQTETCAASFITYLGDTNYGSVGGPSASLQWKLVDVPQMNYHTDHEPPAGQVCMRGECIFSEYFKNPQATSETVDKDGWNHTGDIGQILPNGSLKIIDRKKNIFKLSQGEYVAPEKVENIYARAKAVGESFVYGDSLQHFNVAIVHPNLQALLTIAKKLQIQETEVEKLCEDERIVKYIHDEMLNQGKTDGLMGFEQAKKIKLWPVPFMKVGILTSTMKLQRYLAKKVFKEEIQKLYIEQKE